MGNMMAPFKKFLSNKNTITILGVLLGLVVLYFGYTWRVNQSVQPVEVPYAVETLFAGHKITEEDVGYTQIPKDSLSYMTNLLTDIGSIKDQLVSYDSKIAQNGFFFSENLIDEKDMPDSIFSDLPDGYTVYSMKVDYQSTYANSIFPDDTIDLYLHSTTEDDLVVFGRFIKSIKVLAVRDDEGKNVFANKDEPGEPTALLFAVPEDLFLLLSKAKYLGIDIVPVPRNSAYTEHASATEVQAADLEQMILEKTYVIPNECTDLTTC